MIKVRTRFHIVMQIFFIFKNQATTSEIYEWLIDNKVPILSDITKGTLVAFLREDINIKNICSGDREAIWEWKS
jgi:hypothetical protein